MGSNPFGRRVHLAGARVVAMHPYAPLLCGAVSTALVSYRDRAQMGIALDTGAVIDPDLFMRCVRESFDEVIGLASPPAPARAEPAVRQGT